METMTIESRHLTLSGTTTHGRKIVDEHGKYWHVMEEKLRIPRLNRPGYLLQAEDGFFMILRKKHSEHFKVENEFFKEIEITLGYQTDIQEDDTSVVTEESSESRQ